MKKIIYLALGIIIILGLAACSKKQESDKKTISDPISSPGQYTSDMINLKKNMEQNVQNSVNQENEKISDATNETDNPSADEAGNSTNKNTMDYVKNYTGAAIKTNFGDITVKFRNQETPNTVNNFLKLADQKFYDGTKFHRIIKGFMIQGGDPNSKTADTSSWGLGGPGYKFADELTGKEAYPQGTLAMANSGLNTNGSQFFIVTASPEAPLPPSYTVFGQVVTGIDVALKIENVKTTTNDRPVEDVVINSVELVK